MENIDFAEEKSPIQGSGVLESEDTISFQTERNLPCIVKKQLQKGYN